MNKAIKISMHCDTTFRRLNNIFHISFENGGRNYGNKNKKSVDKVS